MMRVAAAATLLLASSALAQAQTLNSASPDASKLLLDLSKKIDRLQADVDRLKKVPKTVDPDPALSVQKAAAVPAVPSQLRKGGGWAVGVYPRPLDKRPAERVGRFITGTGGFAFGDFRRTVAHPGWASFKGEGLYIPKKVGKHRYVFSTRLTWEKNNFGPVVDCLTRVAVEDQEIINWSFNTSSSANLDRGVSGAIDLEQVDGGDLKIYDVIFDVKCSMRGSNQDMSDEFMTETPSYKAWFDAIRFTFGVTGPDDMAVRPPTVQELIHDIDRK